MKNVLQMKIIEHDNHFWSVIELLSIWVLFMNWCGTQALFEYNVVHLYLQL